MGLRFRCIQAGVVVVFFLIPVLVIAAISFTRNIIDSVGTAGEVHLVDLDEDGDTDLIGLTWGLGDLFWYDNDGAGSFTKKTIDTSHGAGLAVYSGDMDGDGDVDLVTNAFSPDKIHWYENDGAESFTKHTVRTGYDNGYTINVANFDSQSGADIVADKTFGFGWFQNSGTGSFTFHEIYAEDSSYRTTHPVDLDEDGDVDIITGDWGSDELNWWKNSGTGSFTKIIIKSSWNNANKAGSADFDGDGDIDIIAGASVQDELIWFENNGSESFTEHMINDSSFDGIFGMHVSDIDGDGDSDVAITLTGADDLLWYENSGTGSFTRHTLSSSYTEPYGLEAADLDGDGDKDIAVALYGNGAGSFDWWQQSGDPAPELSTLSPADGATGIGTVPNLVITFDENIGKAGTGNVTIFLASNNSVVESIAVTGSLVTGSGTSQITINPSSELLESTSYYVKIEANAFPDNTGSAYAGISDTTTWNFTTGEFSAPTLSSLSPSDGTTDVSASTDLSIVFTEAIGKGGTGSVSIYLASNDSLVETINVTSALVSGSGTTTMTINPTADLAGSTLYYIQISANAFPDASGNSYAGISDTTTWNFTTASSAVHGSAGNTARLRRARTQSTPESEDRVTPSLAQVGIFDLGATRVAISSDIEGDYMGTEEVERIERLHMRMVAHTAAPAQERGESEPAPTVQDTEDRFKIRVCTRVQRRFYENQIMMSRVNRRLGLRFGFMCEYRQFP
jgi:hypothetical protein